MKACVLEEIGKLNIKDVEMPVISDDEVLVRVKATGICGSDIPRAYKTGAYSFPLIIGHEFAGEVVGVGNKAGKCAENTNIQHSGAAFDENDFSVEFAEKSNIQYSDASSDENDFSGKRVGVFPLIPCMACKMCKNKQYEMCSNYGYIGSRQDGAFAEYVKVPRWNIIELPDNVSYKQAAMLEPLAVAIHAARRAGLIDKGVPYESDNIFDSGMLKSDNEKRKTADDYDVNIAIIGLGTIGLLLAMVLKNAGYNNIYGICNKELQKQKAVEIGISVSEKLPDIDIFFECVGTKQSINTAIDNTAPNGKVVFVGNPASDITIDKQIYWKILRRQLTVFGTWNSSFTHSDDDDWNYAIKELAKGKLHPEMLITHEYPLDNIIEGFELMRDKKEEYIKVMSTETA